MSAYIVFTRTKTLDQKELEAYWAGIKDTMNGHPIEVLVAYGNHEVLEGDPIEGIVIAKFPTVQQRKTGIAARLTKASRNIVKTGLFIKALSLKELFSSRPFINTSF